MLKLIFRTEKGTDDAHLVGQTPYDHPSDLNRAAKLVTGQAVIGIAGRTDGSAIAVTENYLVDFVDKDTQGDSLYSKSEIPL